MIRARGWLIGVPLVLAVLAAMAGASATSAATGPKPPPWERMRFFEAYALIAGPGALELLSQMLSAGGLFKRREGPEIRACAALAIGRIRSTEARELLQKYKDDKDLVVRNAVSRALREAGS